MDASGAILVFAGVPIAVAGTVLGLSSPRWSLASIFVLAWTGESLIDYGFLPDHVPDVVLLLLLAALTVRMLTGSAVGGRSLVTPYLWEFVALCLIVVISALVTGSGWLATSLFVRFWLLTYGLLVTIRNARFGFRQARWLTHVWVVIGIAQPLVASVKWLALSGEFQDFGNENITGTYAASGGGLNTLLALMGVGFGLGLFAGRRPGVGTLTIAASLWFSLIGGKRATAFVLPFFVLALFLLLVRKGQFTMRPRHAVIVTLSVVAGLLLTMTLTPTLNPEERMGGSIDFGYAWRYAMRYTQGYGIVDGEEYATGRISATATILRHMCCSVPTRTALFGEGPGTTLPSGVLPGAYRERFLELGVEDGVTGFTWLLVQIGFLGTLAYLLLFGRMFATMVRIARSRKTPLTVGTVGVMLVFFFDVLVYSDAFVRSEALLTLLAFCVASVLLFQADRAASIRLSPQA